MKDLIDGVMDMLGNDLNGCHEEDIAVCISSLIGFDHGFETLGPITDVVVHNLRGHGIEIRQ
jgi:hypothetical protein